MNHRSTLGLFDAFAQGVVEPPASSDYPHSYRWTWSVSVYVDHAWRVVAEAPESTRSVAVHIDATCHATASQTAMLELWQGVHEVAGTGLASAQVRIDAVFQRHPVPTVMNFVNDAHIARKHPIGASARRGA